MADPGTRYRSGEGRFVVRDIFHREQASLAFLSASEITVERTVSSTIAFPEEEVLLFNLRGAVQVEAAGVGVDLEHYDALYVPVGAGIRFRHDAEDAAWLYAYRARAKETHPLFHSSFRTAQTNEERIRRLNRKIVYIMLDVGDEADKFIAGYTFYQDHTRAWPPHNHTDQEEVYSFIEGSGAMSVYEDEEHQTFVTSVGVGDHVTIPLLNYHPVFSDRLPVTFIWCIAGERYWVGDRSTDFMKGSGGKITT